MKMMISSAFAILALSTSLAMAGGFGTNAFGSANSSGFAGTAVAGKHKSTYSSQSSDTSTRATTGGLFAYGGAKASLDQATGGMAVDRKDVAGQLRMDGATSAFGQIGNTGVGSNSRTVGEADTFGSVLDGRGVVSTQMSGKSTQGSVAADTRFGGLATAEATQTTSSATQGLSMGRGAASTEVGASSSSTAEANGEVSGAN